MPRAAKKVRRGRPKLPPGVLRAACVSFRVTPSVGQLLDGRANAAYEQAVVRIRPYTRHDIAHRYLMDFVERGMPPIVDGPTSRLAEYQNVTITFRVTDEVALKLDTLAAEMTTEMGKNVSRHDIAKRVALARVVERAAAEPA